MIKKSAGFSLIELMITVAIIAIIASIAYPSYQEQVSKTRRGEGKAALMSAANLAERYFTANSTYDGLIFGGSASTDSENGYYTIAYSAKTKTTYTLKATRKGAQVGDKCGDLTITQTGAKGIVNPASGITADNCW